MRPTDDLRPQDWRFARTSNNRDYRWLYPDPERGDLWVVLTCVVLGLILLAGLL